jgi:hypothetical protein
LRGSIVQVWDISSAPVAASRQHAKLERPPAGTCGFRRVRSALVRFLICIALLSGLFASIDTGANAVGAAGATPATAATTRTRLQSLRMINYAPHDGAQTNIWTNWQPSTLDTDFARIAAMHANAVRVFTFTPIFGYPTISPTMSGELAQLIALADRHGLRVAIVLFGFWNNYSDIANDKLWASSVIAPYANDPRVAYVDVQNELDSTNAAALAWALSMVPYVQSQVGDIPVTISVSGADGVAGLQRLVTAGLPLDFLDFHYYGRAESAFATLRQALSVAGATPLYVGEEGYSSLARDNPSETHGAAWWEAYQDLYQRSVQYAARALGLPPCAPWTFSDFVAGAFPPGSKSGLDPTEYDFGLYHIDGTAKPIATSLSAIFAGNPVDTAFDNGFEQDDGSGMPADWRIWQPTAAVFARDTTVAHTGGASVRIGASGVGPNGLPSFFATPITFVAPGESYGASVWARGANATGFTVISLGWFDTDGKWISTDSSTPLKGGTTDWTQLTVTARAPASAASAQISLVSANNSGTVWFDDVATAATDGSPPSVGSVTPANGAGNVATASNPAATFTKAMDPATLHTAITVTVQGSTTHVDGVITYDAASQTATFSPTNALRIGTTYTVQIRGGSGGAQDLAGDTMVGDVVWSFTTTIPPAPRSSGVPTDLGVPVAPSPPSRNAPAGGTSLSSPVVPPAPLPPSR